MNKVILIGRLTKDPEVRYGQGEGSTVGRFSLAVDRKYKRDGENNTDFINCVAFGKSAEFVEKYFHKGSKMVVTGRIQTGSYTNKEGQKVYTTDVVAEEIEFGESKGSEEKHPAGKADEDGFMSIPSGIDEELPFV